MTAFPHQSARIDPIHRRWYTVRELWASLAISAMWLAVLFDGVFGGDIVNASSGSSSTVPSAVAVALFALIATVAVAHAGFRRRGGTDA